MWRTSLNAFFKWKDLYLEGLLCVSLATCTATSGHMSPGEDCGFRIKTQVWMSQNKVPAMSSGNMWLISFDSFNMQECLCFLWVLCFGSEVHVSGKPWEFGGRPDMIYGDLHCSLFSPISYKHWNASIVLQGFGFDCTLDQDSTLPTDLCWSKSSKLYLFTTEH